MKNRDNIESLYIHIPFCEHLCDYCDFTKLQYFRIFAEPYIKELINEIHSLNIESPLKTIYIGGGTPTALEDDLFEQLLKEVSPLTSEVEEYTVECNPESLSETKLSLMKKYGVNRLSIGVESTNDEILKAINRHHTFKDVQNAVSNARKHGFNNINVDLILGLPNVTKTLLLQDIENIVELNPEHISCYSLTVHDHTVFEIKNISEPEEDFARDLYDGVHEFLSKKGYEHYEISNWAKEGRRSKHNLTYWKDNQYFGVGLGASGFERKIRYTNTKNIQEYNLGNHRDIEEIVSREEDEEYFIMLTLRTLEGLSYKEFERRFAYSFKEKHQKTINDFVKRKLLIEKDETLIPTYEGMMILDQIVLDLLSD